MLYERFVCLRPLCRVAAWMADMGLAISPGTLADSIKRFAPLFEPLYEAILAHQNEAALRHADETSWRVQAYRKKGRSSRAWLWTSVSDDAVCFHIDPSRSAEAAMKLFGSVKETVVLVCDRYSAYRSLARELAGKVILQWCWAHQRRSFIDRAAGHVRLRRWCQRWIERIALIYRLNDDRLEHYDPAHPLERQSPAFDAAHARLKEAVDELFATAETELAGMTDRARKARPLRSLLKHREGLCVFVDKPFVPMDNNTGEREIRSAVIGRRLSFGSTDTRADRYFHANLSWRPLACLPQARRMRSSRQGRELRAGRERRTGCGGCGVRAGGGGVGSMTAGKPASLWHALVQSGSRVLNQRNGKST